MILFVVFMPVIAAAFAGFIKNDNIRDVSNIFWSAITFLLVLGSFFSPSELGFSITGELPIHLDSKSMGQVFALLASFLWIITNIYAAGYMRASKEKNLRKFYVFFALAVFCALGVAFSGNLVTMFLFYELMTLVTYPLVIHSGSEEAKRAGRLYLFTLFGSSLFFIIAMVLTWQMFGTLDFTNPPRGITGASPYLVGITFFLFVFGTAKAALMPLHRWLPAAMVAPIPVSALLHAVAVVKAGVFVIIKVVVFLFAYDFDFPGYDLNIDFWAGKWLTYIAGITIILSSVKALKQDSIKKMLAYSTINQLAYIILAASLFSAFAIDAALVQLVAHSFAKITWFFTAGAIAVSTGITKIAKISGIARKLPVTIAAFAIGALSIIGIPPTAGFISKFFIIVATANTEQYFAIAALIISTLLASAYYGKFIYLAYLGEATQEIKVKRLPRSMVIGFSITAFFTVFLSLSIFILYG